MKKLTLFLAGLLSVQLVLAVTMHLSSRDYRTFEATEKLLTFDAVDIDRISIDDGDSQLVIARKGETWVLPDSQDFPAATADVDTLLRKLSEMEKGWPVATSKGALRRFKVDSELFERKLILSSGEREVAQLLVGSSPGFRKVHARPVGEEAVYSVAFNSWEASVAVDDWMDKSILQIDSEKVSRIEMPEVSLHREDGKLSLTSLNDQELTDNKEADSLLRKLATLRIDGLADTAEAAIAEAKDPELEIKVTLSEDEPLVYRFWQPEDASYYLLERSDQKLPFKVAKYLVDDLAEVSRDKLVAKPEEANSEQSEESIEQSASVQAG